MTSGPPRVAGEVLHALPRALAVLATWALLTLALPGIGRPGGFGHVAFVALVPWGLWIRRPGRRAFLVEWLATALGMVGVVYWLVHVVPPAVVLIPLVAALYMAGAGVLLRHLARALPLALAVPAAWTAGELVRGVVPVPAAFLWHRLGHMAHDTGWLVGAARVGGSLGLTWVFAAFAGMVADLLLQRRGQSAHGRAAVLLAGLGPLGLAVLASALVAPPASEPGPVVLLVQPGIEQEVKNFSQDPLEDVFGGAVELTRKAVAGVDPPPDLVLWGETMVPSPIPAPGLEEAMSAGASRPAWTGSTLEPRDVRWMRLLAEALVPGVLFGREQAVPVLREVLRSASPWAERARAGEAALPPGTSFAAGAEEYSVVGDEVRRRNSYFVWDAEGRRGPAAAKVHLVPGGETLMGAHGLPFVLDLMLAVGGYVPDFVPGERTEVLGFRDRQGREWRFGVAICFDNVFDDPFLAPVGRERVDFTVVASNEAWYRRSHEMDQMVAMSRVAAVASGRSVVRATNSGTSIVIGPDGRDVAVLEVDGRRKMVSGTLLARVPVPRRDAAGEAPVPFFARHCGAVQSGFAALVVLLGLLAGRIRRAGTDPSPGRA